MSNRIVRNQSSAPPQTDVLPRIGAGCLVVLGLGMALLAFGGIVTQDGALAGEIVLGAIGLGFGAAGFFWLRFVTDADRRRREEFEEKAVLSVAATHAGFVTISQIALESALSASEAERVINRLCGRGMAQPELLEDGTVRYRFTGLIGE
jgi:hypothetical protein